MEAGPPDTLPAQFRKLFDEKEKQTDLDADAAMTALGWLDWLAVSRCFRAWLAIREASEPAVLSRKLGLQSLAARETSVPET